eukprot:1141740-Pelagomonas_calceolata.AAC.1
MVGGPAAAHTGCAHGVAAAAAAVVGAGGPAAAQMGCVHGVVVASEAVKGPGGARAQFGMPQEQRLQHSLLLSTCFEAVAVAEGRAQ